MTLAHVAMRGNAAGCTKGLAFLKFFAHLRKQSDYAAQIVAHQIEKASQDGMFSMHLHKFAITGMDRQLGRRQCKYKPAIAEIDRRKFQHSFEERTIGCRVLAVEKKMRSRNHCGSILISRKMNSLNNALL